MTASDWLALLHPVLMVLFVYPVVGATIRLGILVREKRLGITEQPDLVPVEHAAHGAWVSAGAVVAVLIALLYRLWSPALLSGLAAAGGLARLLPLSLLAAASLAGLLAGLRVRRPLWRAVSCWSSWGALLVLGQQTLMTRAIDNPFGGGFWGSHYWSGALLVGLLLATTAARPEIIRRPRWRRLHLAANLLIMLLLAVQAITGTRDLLAMPIPSRQAAALAPQERPRGQARDAAEAGSPRHPSRLMAGSSRAAISGMELR